MVDNWGWGQGGGEPLGRQFREVQEFCTAGFKERSHGMESVWLAACDGQDFLLSVGGLTAPVCGCLSLEQNPGLRQH